MALRVHSGGLGPLPPRRKMVTPPPLSRWTRILVHWSGGYRVVTGCCSAGACRAHVVAAGLSVPPVLWGRRWSALSLAAQARSNRGLCHQQVAGVISFVGLAGV